MKAPSILILSERIYPSFWTQTPLKMAEFSDRPMAPPPLEDQYYGFFPAKYTTAYLESYIDDHVYAGRSIRDRILFNAAVDSVTRAAPPQSPPQPQQPQELQRPIHQWTLTYNTSHTMHSSKLIDATGLTSQPHIPHLPGSSDFLGKTLHHKTFGQEQQRLLLPEEGGEQHDTSTSTRNICILGGAKSAADVAYAFAKASMAIESTKKKTKKTMKIHWIIRSSGNGPSAFFAAPPPSARYANSNEGFYNRFLASFLPSKFGTQRWGWVKWALQGTVPGRWYVGRLWDGFDRGLRGFLDYGREEGREMGFANLEYDTP